MGMKFKMLAKTSFGFEDLLIKELQEIGAESCVKATRAVHFEGDQSVMYKANLHSRLALRILKPIKTFPATNEKQLYDEVRKIDWSTYMRVTDTLAVDAVTSHSNLTHSLYVSLKTKDAIVDQFRDQTGERPSVDLRFPTLRINVHLHDNKASLSLDSSGDSLHKRGYREQQGEAPLNETLAAGMVLLSGWDQKSPLTDFMCGSGTIVIEAAMIARKIAPGKFRREFGFERWKDYDDQLWKTLLSESVKAELPSLTFRITGIDRSRQAISYSRDNARAAGVINDIDFNMMRFEDYTPEIPEQTIITNPPYGGRITDDDLFSLYKGIGDKLKGSFPGSTAWVLTANKEASKKIGLHPSAKVPLFNGALECRMLKYDLYKGSKKAAKQENEK